MVRLLVVSDLHFPSDNKNIWNLTMLLRRISIDALVLAGDFLDSVSTNTVRKMFRLLRGVYRGTVFAVWGNHEHSLTRNRLRKDWSSLDQLRWLQDHLEEYSVKILDVEAPANIGEASIVGVVGWYDYSYEPSIYTLEDYERCNPFGVSLNILQDCERGY